MFEALVNNLDQTALGILISMFTGIRIGELCALTWKDISLENNTIRIQRTMQRIQTPDDAAKTKVFILEPKSSSSVREIPIAKVLREYLEQQQKKEGYVLSGKVYKYVEPRTVQNRFKGIMKNCNIDNASFHTLRHTFATRCIEIGFDIKSVSEILGHANVNITLNRYVHPSMDSKQKNMDMLSDLFIVK